MSHNRALTIISTACDYADISRSYIVTYYQLSDAALRTRMDSGDTSGTRRACQLDHASALMAHRVNAGLDRLEGMAATHPPSVDPRETSATRHCDTRTTEPQDFSHAHLPGDLSCVPSGALAGVAAASSRLRLRPVSGRGGPEIAPVGAWLPRGAILEAA